MITYNELASGLEDAWMLAGLHEHAIIETINSETLERGYRVEIFPEHPEPLTDAISPPWVELTFTWSPAHQLYAEGRPDVPPGILELSWTYTVDVRNQFERHDVDLVRSFNQSIRSALHRAAPDVPIPTDYIAVEIRRGYRVVSEKLGIAYIQIIGTNVTDLSDLWTSRSPDALREVLRDELSIVAALLHALGETFAPGGLGGYRSVDTA